MVTIKVLWVIAVDNINHNNNDYSSSSSSSSSCSCSCSSNYNNNSKNSWLVVTTIIVIVKYIVNICSNRFIYEFFVFLTT